MLNLRRFSLQRFETLFEQVFTQAIEHAEQEDFILQSLFGIGNLSVIVNHFKQFQQRRQCLQRLRTYHICETCYHSGICLCEDCYNEEDHRGHRVTERHGSGYCDCGVLKHGGLCNCRNHNPRVPVKENLLQIAFGDDLEYAKGIVRIVLKRISIFIKTTYNERLLTNFALIMTLSRSLLQAEALYQLFGEIFSEFDDDNQCFFRSIYQELNTMRIFPETFYTYFVYGWFIPLAMHPSNYKHYISITGNNEINRSGHMKFVRETLFVFHDFPKSFLEIKNVIEYDRNLLIFNDLISFYLHPDMLRLRTINKLIADGMKVILSMGKEIDRAYRLLPFADTKLLEYSLLIITKSLVHFTPNCRIITENDLCVLRDIIYNFINQVSDETIETMISLLNPITSMLKKKTIQKILEFCFNENKLKPIEGIIMQYAGNKLTLPSVIFTPFENISNIMPIEIHHDFLDLMKLRCQPLTMDMLNECMNSIKILLEIEQYEKSHENEESNLIEFIEEKYQNIEREIILILIVWYMNFNKEKIQLYITQRSCYLSEQRNITNFGEEKVTMKIEDILSRNKMQEKIVCNPFVPLTFGYQQNLYLFFCFIGKKVIGHWKGEENIKFLSSTDLSVLMFETFMKQPLYVIHLLWKRILFNIKIESDEMGIMIFSLFPDFLKIYPMWKNELFRLSIAYEEVTIGSQQTFIDSLK